MTPSRVPGTPATAGRRSAVFSGPPGRRRSSASAREQADGRHLVDFGAGKLVVAASDQPWERRRLTFAGHPLLRSMERDDWHIVGVWGPWTYLKRPARTPAGCR